MPTDSPLAEQMALVLADRGMQRMTARVLSGFLFTDQPSLTMGEVGTQLGASTGSVSMSIKSLLTAGLVERVPAEGRRDHFRLRDDAWERLFTSQNDVLPDLVDIARRGAAATDPTGVAHQRLHRMQGFYEFLQDELPGLVERWQQQRDC